MIEFDKTMTRWSPVNMTGVVMGPVPVHGISGTHAKPQDFEELRALDGSRPFKFRHDGREMVVGNARCGYLEINEDGTEAEFSIGTTP